MVMEFYFPGISTDSPLSSPPPQPQQQPPSERPRPNPNPNPNPNPSSSPYRNPIVIPPELDEKTANELLNFQLCTRRSKQQPPRTSLLKKPDADLRIRLEFEKEIYFNMLVILENSLKESAKESGLRARILLGLAKAYCGKKELQKSKGCLQSATEILNNGKMCKTIDLVGLYYHIALVYRHMGETDLSTESFNRLIAIVNQPKKISEEEMKVAVEQWKALEALRIKRLCLVWDGNAEEARKIPRFDHRTRFYRRKPEAPLNPDADLNFLEEKEKYFEALVVLERYLRESSEESETRAHVLIAMAIASFENARFVYSKRCLKTASEVLGKMEETVKIAEAYGKIGMLYESMDECKLAKPLFERMVSVYNKQHSQEKAEMVEEGIARAISLFQLKRFEESKRCLKIAGEILVNGKMEKTIKVARAYEKMGMLYERMGEYELAISFFQRMPDNYPYPQEDAVLTSARLLLLSGKEEYVGNAIFFLNCHVAAKLSAATSNSTDSTHIGLRSYYKFLAVAYIMLSRYELAENMFAAMHNVMEDDDSSCIAAASCVLFKAHGIMKRFKDAVERKPKKIVKIVFPKGAWGEIINAHQRRRHLARLKIRARVASRVFHKLVKQFISN